MPISKERAGAILPSRDEITDLAPQIAQAGKESYDRAADLASEEHKTSSFGDLFASHICAFLEKQFPAAKVASTVLEHEKDCCAIIASRDGVLSVDIPCLTDESAEQSLQDGHIPFAADIVLITTLDQQPAKFLDYIDPVSALHMFRDHLSDEDAEAGQATRHEFQEAISFFSPSEQKKEADPTP